MFFRAKAYWIWLPFVPESLRRVLLKSAAKNSCQLAEELFHLPTSHANFSRATSPANFSRVTSAANISCQHFESYSIVISPANFSCQLSGCYLGCGAVQIVLSSANPRACRNCGVVRICLELGEPSAEIVRVEAFSLWRRANLSWSRRTLCGDRACQSALSVAPCEFALSSVNPLRRSCVSKRSCCGCGAVQISRARRTLCRDRACRNCGVVRISLDLGEPSAEMARVEAHSRWRRSNFVALFSGSRMVVESCLVVCASAFLIAASWVRFSAGLR